MLGGKCDPNERFDQTIIREVEEEGGMCFGGNDLSDTIYQEVDEEGNLTITYFLTKEAQQLLVKPFDLCTVDEWVGPENLLLKWITPDEMCKSFPRYQRNMFNFYYAVKPN